MGVFYLSVLAVLDSYGVYFPGLCIGVQSQSPLPELNTEDRFWTETDLTDLEYK